jgi:hypothetical protein
MILDSRNEFSDAYALNTGGAGTYALGSIIDLGAAQQGREASASAMRIVIILQTTATSGGLATAQFHVVSDSTTTLATDGSATYHFSTGAIPVATLVWGYRILSVGLPPGRYERYLGILQTTGVAALTAGKIDAFLTNGPSGWRAYPNAANA